MKANQYLKQIWDSKLNVIRQDLLAGSIPINEIACVQFRGYNPRKTGKAYPQSSREIKVWINKSPGFKVVMTEQLADKYRELLLEIWNRLMKMNRDRLGKIMIVFFTNDSFKVGIYVEGVNGVLLQSYQPPEYTLS